MKFSALIRPLLALAIPVALGACGSTGTNADGGDLSGGDDLASACAAGVTPFAIAPGTYTVSNASVRPLATSLETMVEAVLGTSPSSVAAARTEIPGRRPTSHSSSDCA